MVLRSDIEDYTLRSIAWPSPVQAWWTVGCVVMAAFLCTMDRLVLNLLADPIRSDLHISETQFSFLVGLSFTVVYSLGALPIGLLADKSSRRNLLLFGIFVWSLATALGGLSSGYGEFLTARIFVGMGEAALWPVAVSLIADVMPAHQRGRAVGLVLLGQIIGSGVSLIMTGVVIGIAQRGGFDFLGFARHMPPWRLVLVIWGGLGLIAILMLFTIKEPARRASHSVVLNGASTSVFMRYVWERRAIILPLYFGACCISVGSYSLAAWAPSFFIRTFALSPVQIGPILGYVGIGTGIVGTQLAGFLSDREEKRGSRDRKFTILIGAALGSLPGAFLIFAPNATIAVIIQGFSVLFPPIAAILNIVVLQDILPNEMRGKGMAVQSLFSGMLGATIGPTLTAMVTQYVYGDDKLVGYSLMTVLIPALFIACFCFWIARRNIRRQASPVDQLGRESLVNA